MNKKTTTALPNKLDKYILPTDVTTETRELM